ncbi:glucosaminidase domain-containing protein [Rheinheimera sp.]|uniref:glucosaminidase domain-containing protein n=1 Tax=Rheinheimera sp. TaxID=1869214 RepID=UPI00307FB72C
MPAQVISRLGQVAVAAVVLYCAAYPFLNPAPVEDIVSLEEWQMPSKLAALDAADQRKLLKRLAYPVSMPELSAVPDFSAMKDVDKKKKKFFGYLLPFVERENARLLNLRHQIIELEQQYQQRELTVEEYAFLFSLYDEFKLDYPDVDATGFTELLKRVDVIPAELVLVQAAKESGWGSSRFALEAYNFFGQWCFKAGCGLVPSQRGAGKYHEVAVFPHVAAAVTSYFYNLNTFYQYEELRALRAKQRSNGEVKGQHLVAGLLKYSERGQAYVNEIEKMLRVNDQHIES